MDLLIDAATSFQPSVPISQFANVVNNINTDGQDTQQIQTQASALPYGYRFAHLCHIPMFPLYGPADTLALQKAQERKAAQLERLIPEPATKDKIILTALSLSVGGAGFSTDRKLKNGITKFGAKSIQTTMDQNKLCVLTRWAVRPGTEKIGFFVDVLEYRFVKGWKGNSVLLKTSKDAPAIKLLKKSVVKGLKPTKTWSKNFNFEPVEEMKMVGADKAEVEMEIVAKEERVCSGVESRAVQRRFEYEWWIPSLV